MGGWLACGSSNLRVWHVRPGFGSVKTCYATPPLQSNKESYQINCKDDDHVARGTHVASHGYVSGKDNLEFIGATHSAVKEYSTKRKKGLPVWPSEDRVEVAPEIGYISHFPELGESSHIVN